MTSYFLPLGYASLPPKADGSLPPPLLKQDTAIKHLFYLMWDTLPETLGKARAPLEDGLLPPRALVFTLLSACKALI